MRLRTKLVLLVSVILITSLGIAYLFLSSSTNKNVRYEIGHRAQAIAAMTAASPDIIGAMKVPEQHYLVQQYAENIRKETGVEFVVVFDNNGIRLSHPNADLIGKHIVGGDESASLQGATYISMGEGTLGKSIRAFRPVLYEGTQIGAVLVGVSMEDAQRAVSERNVQFVFVLFTVFVCGVALTLLFSQRVKDTLLGMEPFAIAKLTVERNTVIQSVREGILVVDTEGTILIVNEEARRIFHQADITGNLIGKNSEQVVPNTHMLDVVKSGKPELDQEQQLNHMCILTNRIPLIVNGQIVGSLATFRDLAEIRQLAEELTGVKRYVEALRAQTHEFRNKLHIINGLILNEQYQTLSQYVQQLSGAEENEMRWIRQHVKDSVISAFLQSKLSRSREMGVHLILNNDISVSQISDNNFRNDLVTLIGNLVDNAIEAVQFTDIKNIELLVQQTETHWFVQVADTGKGITDDIGTIFRKGYSTKGEHRGFGLFLVGKIVEKYNGNITIYQDKIYKTIFKIYIFPKGAVKL